MIEIPSILPKEKITALIKDYQENKNEEAKDQVVMNNIKLVYSLAHKYGYQEQANGYTFDDFVSEGVIGLMKAIESFDTNRGLNFTTYAYWWVMKSITKTLTRGTLNIPQHRMNLLRRYEDLAKKYTDAGNPPNLKEIAKKLKVSEKIIVDTVNQSEVFFVESHDYWGPHGHEIEDKIVDNIYFDRIWSKAKKELKHEQIEVIEQRFGFNGEAKTLQEISESMNISKEYVRRLQKSAIEQMRIISKRRQWR